MGNYAVEADVQARESLLETVTTPSSAEVVEIISQIESEIDAALAFCGYTTPITNTDDINLLQRFVSIKAAAEAWHMAYIGDAPDKIKTYEEDYKAFMLRVRECRIMLNTNQASTVGTVSVGTAKFNSDARFD